MSVSNRSTPRLLAGFHGRPWAGAFNVVMATGVVSIAARNAGLEALSVTLLWVAVAAFLSLAALDVWLVRHPLAMIRRAAHPGQGFHALGFVADGCVIGVRIAGSGTVELTVATVLLACGFVLWLLILTAVVFEHGRGGAALPSGEWLLTVVATEGLAILAARIDAHHHVAALHAGATVLWILGGLAYVVVMALLVHRATRPAFGLAAITPDWWIVMGAPAIWCLAAVEITGTHPGTAGASVAWIAWGLASVMLIGMSAADALRAGRFGLRFSPERWTMVFPLGMYSVASWSLGRSLPAGWLSELGRLWLAVAFAAWAAAAVGELRHLLLGATPSPVPGWRGPGPPRAAG